MIKTTKTMLSKAWAICSAFKPEEALHNERLNKTIEADRAHKRLISRFTPRRGLLKVDYKGVLPGTGRGSKILNSSAVYTKQDFVKTLEQDKNTGFSNEGGAK